MQRALGAALFARFGSRGRSGCAARTQSAMCRAPGGHDGADPSAARNG
jgi:hypothetical protein